MYGYSFGGKLPAKMFKMYLDASPYCSNIEVHKPNKFGIVNVWWDCEIEGFLEQARNFGKMLNEQLYGVC